MVTMTTMAMTVKTTTMAMHKKSKMEKTATTAKAMATTAKTTKTMTTTTTTTTMMATIGGGLWDAECAQKAATCGSSNAHRTWRTRRKAGIVEDGEPAATTTFVPQRRASAERRQEQVKARRRDGETRDGETASVNRASGVQLCIWQGRPHPYKYV
ncbi:hypothetical protein CBR_g6592 [Chara braunii]|uniref:Uncharacterized protein n=1 Tax=Chara braunii TaxID=69332 RepID=A0A388KK88_CHABU|nr:hypothetical protein CBR_g6592 [Chara braunii]|eukprot:GBG70464.1 hypothetical protein CBR_g6592 [Chara braunii]